MGYSYIFRLSVDSEEKEFLESLGKEYCLLQGTSDWFPTINEEGHTGSKGYGVGENEHLKEEFLKLSTKFLEVTFVLYLIYWDFYLLDVFEVKGDSWKEISHLDGEKIGVTFRRIEIEGEVIPDYRDKFLVVN